MREMLGAREGWAGISKRLRLLQRRLFCSNKNKPSTSSHSSGGDKGDGSLSTYKEQYRQLDDLDFMTATKILFTAPPKKKKFGIDFHLVQLFFACMPSLAVYLVAQYARYEMRRMEAEMELKKQAEEEAKAKETELNTQEEKDAGVNPELSEVKVRLDKLEAAVKEIVVESKKQRDIPSTKKQEDSNKKSDQAATDNTADKEQYKRQTSENPSLSSGQGGASSSAQPSSNSSQ
ncbi:hypothetical protein NMG60_11004831 [Bertholletia excelsa]